MLLLLFTTACSSKKYISRVVKVDISKCNTIIDEDTHGGFLGDGELFYKASCKNSNLKDEVKNWKEFPLTENLNSLVYDEEKTFTLLSKYFDMPRIENGYYLFIDRHSESNDSRDDSNLFSRASMNFSLAIYDADTGMFYYYDLDT